MRPMKKIAVLFSGEGTNFAHIAKTLDSSSAHIALAVTNNPNAGGIEIAKAHNIPLKVISPNAYTCREAYDKALVEEIDKKGVDLVVLAGFMRILTPVFTDNIKAINLHPSLLPRHKGTDAIRRSFDDGHLEGGVSVHWVTDELDGGEVILQKTVQKIGLSFQEYDSAIRAIEKEALSDAIKVVLS